MWNRVLLFFASQYCAENHKKASFWMLLRCNWQQYDWRAAKEKVFSQTETGIDLTGSMIQKRSTKTALELNSYQAMDYKPTSLDLVCRVCCNLRVSFVKNFESGLSKNISSSVISIR